jgi:hypothetical protein
VPICDYCRFSADGADETDHEGTKKIQMETQALHTQTLTIIMITPTTTITTMSTMQEMKMSLVQVQVPPVAWLEERAIAHKVKIILRTQLTMPRIHMNGKPNLWSPNEKQCVADKK